MDFENQADYEELVEHSLKEILRHEDFTHFLSWMKIHLGISSQLSLISPPTDHLLPLATCLALAIWNGTPLPGNNFRPRPIPIPKRNQPCVCGSGKKYNKCCSMGEQQLLDIDENMIWPILMEALPEKVLNKGLNNGTLPLGARVLYCAETLDEGNSEKVIQLLKDYYFANSHKDTGEHAAFGLTLLFEAFGQQGMQDRKLDLIEHISSTVPSSPLRSEALQRLVTIQADLGNLSEAFKTLKKARKDTPHNPDIGLLEVQLLLVKGDLSLAQQRARFIAKQIRRLDAEFPDDVFENPMLDFLEQVIEDPEKATFVMGGMNMANDSALVQWLKEQHNRPVLQYLFDEEKGFSDMIEDYSAADRAHFAARTPSAIQKIEDAWNDGVYPIEPLFGVNLVPFGDDDPWNNPELTQWKDFLLDHPESIDSIAIIDDLLTLLSLHPAWGQAQIMESLFEPLLHRGIKIVTESLQNLPEEGCLPWLITENRPFLRTLVRAMINARFAGDYALTDRITRQLLKLNPADNHGLRCDIINQYLHANNNLDALVIAENFPDDLIPDILYGRVLALYRLGRKEEALIAAQEAKRQSPKVASYLISPQRKEPQESSPFGILSGSRQEAWEYRVEMREVWKESRGLLTWLKKA